MPKPEKSDVGARIVRAQADRAHSEITQDLRAKPDFAPEIRTHVVRSGLFGAAEIRRHACRSITQIYERAAPLRLEAGQHLWNQTSENVAHNIGAMQPRRHFAPIADLAMHEGEVEHRIEMRPIGVALEISEMRLDGKGRDPFDQLLARLPVCDEFGDRNPIELVALGEIHNLLTDHHRAVVICELADCGDRRQPRELAQVDRCLSVARTHQDTALLGDQWKHVPGADEIIQSHVAVCESTHGVRALLRRNPGSQAMLDVDRDREGRAKRRVVDSHHGRKMQAPGIVGRQRRTDDPAAVANDKSHLLWRAELRRDDKIAFILAIIIIGDDDDFTTSKGLNDGGDGTQHVRSMRRKKRLAEEIVRRDRAARLGDNALGGLAGYPGPVLAADQGHCASGDANAASEICACDTFSLKPVAKLHFC